jgi:hypothetical protein
MRIEGGFGRPFYSSGRRSFELIRTSPQVMDITPFAEE